MRSRSMLRTKARRLIRFLAPNMQPEQRCEFCRVLVVVPEWLPKGRIVERTHAYVEWRTPKGRRRELIATIEHVIPLADGGTNTLGNLAIACYPCNQARGRIADKRRMERLMLTGVA